MRTDRRGQRATAARPLAGGGVSRNPIRRWRAAHRYPLAHRAKSAPRPLPDQLAGTGVMLEPLQDLGKNLVHHRLHHQHTHQCAEKTEFGNKIHAYVNFRLPVAARRNAHLRHGPLYRHGYFAQLDFHAPARLPLDDPFNGVLAVVNIASPAVTDAFVLFAQLIGCLDERMKAGDAAEIGQIRSDFFRRQIHTPRNTDLYDFLPFRLWTK